MKYKNAKRDDLVLVLVLERGPYVLQKQQQKRVKEREEKRSSVCYYLLYYIVLSVYVYFNLEKKTKKRAKILY